MTHRFYISPCDSIEIRGLEYRLHLQNDDGVILKLVENEQICIPFTHEELVELINKPDTLFRRDYYSSAQAALRARSDIRYLSSLPPERRALAVWKETYCKVLSEMISTGAISKSDHSIQSALPAITIEVDRREKAWQQPGRQMRAGKVLVAHIPPSASTLRRWYRSYEKFGKTPIVFIRKPGSGSKRKGVFCSDAEALLNECLRSYLTLERVNGQRVVDYTTQRFSEVNRGLTALNRPLLRIPSARTIRRRIQRIDPFELYAQRYGLDAARKHFTIYEQGIGSSRPLQRVELDEWQIDLVSLLSDAEWYNDFTELQRSRLDIGRRWAYVAIDCATRCIVAFRIVAQPNADDAIRTVALITVDKTSIAKAAGCICNWDFFGGIGELITDQGPAFLSPEFRAAVAETGATRATPPANNPELRPKIERYFGTLSTKFASQFTGRTFSNIIERGDYSSEERAALTDLELVKAFTTFIVDDYHQSPHRGLNGETPANAWKRLCRQFGTLVPPTPLAHCSAFGIPQRRKLGRHGIWFQGIPYNSEKLQRALLHGHSRDVLFKTNPRDLTYISVHLDNEWVWAEAIPKSVHGISLEEWRSIASELRMKFRNGAKLTEDIVWESRARSAAIDSGARQLASIGPSHWRAADLERTERELFLGLRIRPDGISEPEAADIDLFADIIPVSETRPAPSLDEKLPMKSEPWRLVDD